MSDGEEPLSNMTDEQLGQVVRDTPVFRLAIACAELNDGIGELRESDEVAWDRIVTDTLDGQTRVNAEHTVRKVIDAFLDALESYARLARQPDELAAEAAKEAADE